MHWTNAHNAALLWIIGIGNLVKSLNKSLLYIVAIDGSKKKAEHFGNRGNKRIAKKEHITILFYDNAHEGEGRSLKPSGGFANDLRCRNNSDVA